MRKKARYASSYCEGRHRRSTESRPVCCDDEEDDVDDDDDDSNFIFVGETNDDEDDGNDEDDDLVGSENHPRRQPGGPTHS